MSADTRPRLARGRLTVALAAGVWLALVGLASAQGFDPAGHPSLNGFGVFAAWNPSAGGSHSGGYAIEDHPNRQGWDYRINLPWVRLNSTYFRARSGAAMIGVVEDTTNAATTLQNAVHVNNSIWLFAVDVGGVVRFKTLPSRRSATSAGVENATTLSDGWQQVGPAGPTFKVEKPAAVVLGEGIGAAIIYVVARAADNRVLLTSRRIDSSAVTGWTTPWVEVAPRAGNRPTAAVAFGNRVAVAWSVGFPARIEARLYRPGNGSFGPIRTVAAAGGAPQLVWDGTALNLFYIGPILLQHAWHTFITVPNLTTFRPPTRIGDTVINAHCDAMAFNHRLHVACARLEGRFRVWYSTSTTPYGMPSAWMPASPAGLEDHSEPQIGSLGGEVYVVASSSTGVLQYARKDPHVIPYEWDAYGPARERWLEAGMPVDGLQAQLGIGLWGAELLSFNHDLYLTAADSSSEPSAGLYLANFSRAALKNLMTQRLGIRFVWGREDDDPLFAPNADPIATGGGTFLLADVNRDGRADLIRAGHAPEGGPLLVATSSGTKLDASTLWLPGFARPDDHVRAGDVDGDGFADVVRVFKGAGEVWDAHIAFSSGTGVRSQITWRARMAAGDSLPLLGDVTGDGNDDLVVVRFGPTPGMVDVAAGGPRAFGRPQRWSQAMAVTGDVPLLADVNGDGRKDLVIVSTTPPPAGGAPLVTVAFSTGSRFSSRMRWASALSSFCRAYGVGDMNQDGRDDLVCFRRPQPGGSDKTGVDVLFAQTVRFSLPTTVLTTFADGRDVPLVGNVNGDTKGTYSGVTADSRRPILDLVRVDGETGRVGWMPALGLFPVPSGAPWERYRFFTEKGLGTAMFPDWLWSSTPCVKPAHQYLLLGAAGSGSPRVTRLSVRPGSAQGHVLEELGHSVFFNCFPGPDDPFGLTDDIFSLPVASGGFEANFLVDSCLPQGGIVPGAPTWIDCRDPEHYFLAFMRTYRTSGNLIRSSIAADTDPARQARYQARYTWLRDRWFGGVQFYHDPTVVEARRETHGLQCLPTVCP